MTGATAASPALQHFVQHTLGCGCPVEVFREVEMAPVQWGGVSGSRITIGHRLLIALFETDDENLVRRSLGEWIAAGVETRKAEGLNRVRVVIGSSRPERLAPVAEAVFARCPECDDRTHLHVVHRQECVW